MADFALAAYTAQANTTVYNNATVDALNKGNQAAASMYSIKANEAAAQLNAVQSASSLENKTKANAANGLREAKNNIG